MAGLAGMTHEMIETSLARTGFAAPALRYLALGDSYTIGEGVDEVGRWPMQLVQALRNDGLPVTDPQIIAQTGWTTDELEAAINGARLLPDYDIASLLIGVNNQYRGRSVEEYREQFSQLLERSIGLVQGRHDRVLALSIPDWGVTAFGQQDARGTASIAAEIDAFNAAAQEICRQRDIAFVDITGVSRTLGEQAAMQASDGLHPSALMYAEWTRLALPYARAMVATA